MESNQSQKDKGLDLLSEQELRARLAVVTKIIREAQQDGDPRWEKVAEEQQRPLNEALVRKIQQRRQATGQANPEPVSVGVKSLRVTAKRVRR